MTSARATNTKGAAKKVGRVIPNAPVRRGARVSAQSRRVTYLGDDPRAVAAWICGLLQAGDSFYPTGSYAHSFGLEGLVHAGVVRDRATLREFIFRSVLPALRHADLPLAAHAWRAFAADDWERIGELSALSAALKTAREARMAADNIGRQRAELTASLRENPLSQEYLRRATEASWPFSAPIPKVC